MEVFEELMVFDFKELYGSVGTISVTGTHLLSCFCLSCPFVVEGEQNRSQIPGPHLIFRNYNRNYNIKLAEKNEVKESNVTLNFKIGII